MTMTVIAESSKKLTNSEEHHAKKKCTGVWIRALEEHHAKKSAVVCGFEPFRMMKKMI